MNPATTSQRIKNYIIDNLVCGFGVFILFGIAFSVFHFEHADELFFGNYIWFTLAIRFLYTLIFEYYFFRTIAKVFTKTRVIREDGSAPGFRDILLRTLCRFIPFNEISFMFDANWHDKLSHTRVVTDTAK